MLVTMDKTTPPTFNIKRLSGGNEGGNLSGRMVYRQELDVFNYL